VHQELGIADLERVAEALRGPRRRVAPDLRLEPIASFTDVGDEWDELAERSGNVFATLEWLSLWWRHFGRGKRLLLTACRDRRGDLVALLPLYVASRGRVRVIRFLGHGTADQLGPVCAPEDRRRAARALRRLLLERVVAWDVFLGELLPGDEAWTSLLGARSLARDGSPVLRFQHESWTDYLASRKRGMRKELGRTERRLYEAHDVEFRLCDDEERLPADLDTLFMLHRSRWSDDESPFGAHERFHRDLAAAAFRRGWLYLWFVSVDGEPAAAEYALRFAGAQNHVQGGRHPAFDRLAIGTILFAFSVRAALEDGLRECRFLRGREEYKYRFASGDPELETVGLARGSLGDAALLATLAVRRWHGVGRLRRLFAE
jgi:CelD/BcsL family acetyltransferase involved in cellulose biosynthesis